MNVVKLLKVVDCGYEQSLHCCCFLIHQYLCSGNKSVVASYAFMPGQGSPEEAVQVMKQARDDPAKPIGAVYLAMNDVGFAAKFILESKKQDLKLPLYGTTS